MSGMRSDHPVRLLCDQNLGKLAKWLRILGFDTEYMSRWDEKLITQALKDGKIVLTRKRSISENDGVMLITHDHVREQLQEFLAFIDPRDCVEPFSRCILCNTALVNTSREKVKGEVPEYVYATQEIFARCPSCGHVYWKGTHIPQIYGMIASVTKDKKA